MGGDKGNGAYSGCSGSFCFWPDGCIDTAWRMGEDGVCEERHWRSDRHVAGREAVAMTARVGKNEETCSHKAHQRMRILSGATRSSGQDV